MLPFSAQSPVEVNESEQDPRSTQAVRVRSVRREAGAVSGMKWYKNAKREFAGLPES